MMMVQSLARATVPASGNKNRGAASSMRVAAKCSAVTSMPRNSTFAWVFLQELFRKLCKL